MESENVPFIRDDPSAELKTRPTSLALEEKINDDVPILPENATKVSIDLVFLKRFIVLMSYSGTTFFSIPHLLMWQALFLGIFISQANILGFQWIGSAISLLEGPNWVYVWQRLPYIVTLLATVGFAQAWTTFIADLLAWHWRKNITKRITSLYLQGVNPYIVIYSKNSPIDNSDQRIVDDVNNFASNVALIYTTAVSSILSIGWATYDLYNNAGYEAVLLVYIPFMSLLVVYRFILTRVAKLSFKQDKFEANFRFAHARIREYAESIAFFDGHEMERQNCQKAFTFVLSNQKVLLKWLCIYRGITMLNHWVPEFAIYVVGGLKLWDSSLSTSELAAMMAIIGQETLLIMNAFDSLFNLGTPFGVATGAVARISQLLELCELLKDSHKPTITTHPASIIFKNVTCETPQNTTLVYGLNNQLNPNENVLITGPSGAGKSSLLRCIAGLTPFSGEISRPTEGIFFLPQKPYIVDGNLREQIIYPDVIPKVDDTALEKLLCEVNIEYILHQRGGWNTDVNWEQILSPGEQQRLVFARLLYHRPQFAILDEATSALDSANEITVYEKCIENGITLLSVGHRSTLHQFHQKVISFDGMGNYTISKIDLSKLKTNNSKKWIEESRFDGHLNLKEVEDVDNTIVNVVSDAYSKGNYLIRLFRMWRLMHKEFLSKKTIFLVLLLTFAVLSGLTALAAPNVASSLINALLDKDRSQFILWAGLAVLVGAAIAIVVASTFAFAGYLGIEYRYALTNYIQDSYFNMKVYYKINTSCKEIDNADERIASEIDNITSGIQAMGLPTLTQLVFLAMLAPSASLFQLVILIGWPIVFLIFSYVGIVLVFSVLLISWVGRYNFVVNQAEGDFRYSHIRVRENAESICFHGDLAMNYETKSLTNRFEHLLDVTWDYIKARFLLNIVSNVFLNSYQFMSILLLVGGYAISGIEPEYHTSFVGKSLVTTCLVALNIFLSMMASFAKNNGGTTRVAQLKENIDKYTYEVQPENVHYDTEEEIKFDNVMCETPTGRALLEHPVSFKICSIDKLLIMGPSGCGKSSLLRLFANVWPLTQGIIHSPKSIFFLPQKSYMIIGNLRDQILYPQNDSVDAFVEIQLTTCLRKAKIDYLLSRFNWESVELWDSVLSPGEKQRISIARLYYHKPKFAIIDEGTSALDEENEAEFFRVCKKLGIGILSVGHRETLSIYHNLLLKLDGKGGWSFSSS